MSNLRDFEASAKQSLSSIHDDKPTEAQNIPYRYVLAGTMSLGAAAYFAGPIISGAVAGLALSAMGNQKNALGYQSVMPRHIALYAVGSLLTVFSILPLIDTYLFGRNDALSQAIERTKAAVASDAAKGIDISKPYTLTYKKRGLTDWTPKHRIHTTPLHAKIDRDGSYFTIQFSGANHDKVEYVLRNGQHYRLSKSTTTATPAP